jgi:hypothetical protein
MHLFIPSLIILGVEEGKHVPGRRREGNNGNVLDRTNLNATYTLSSSSYKDWAC